MHRLSSKLELHQSAVDYTKSHNHNIRMALKRLQNKSIVASDSRAPLVSLLVSSGKVFHLPNAVVPRQLRLKRIAYNTEVSVGKHGGILNRELGRGAYGVVVLMNVSKNNISNNIAIKVQCPTDSLAWEYEVLQRLEDRISRNGKVCSSYAFPRPFGFISLADGGDSKHVGCVWIRSEPGRFVELLQTEVRGASARTYCTALYCPDVERCR